MYECIFIRGAVDTIGVVGPKSGLGFEVVPCVTSDIIFLPGAIARFQEDGNMGFGGGKIVIVIGVRNL